MTEIDPLVWYVDRELSFPPRHFVKATTPVTTESAIWVRNTLQGRFCIVTDSVGGSYTFTLLRPSVYFESTMECMLYELRWSASN